MCNRSELVEGAYLKDEAAGQLFEVRESPSRSHVRLTDVRKPVEAKSFTSMPIEQALKRLELVEPARDVSGVASEAEFGSMGTAPT